MFVLDSQTRSTLADERAARLRHDLLTPGPRLGVRRALGQWLIRAGDRLAREPRPCHHELSFRA